MNKTYQAVPLKEWEQKNPGQDFNLFPYVILDSGIHVLSPVEDEWISVDLLRKAINKWGAEVQINKIQEEALELALILNQRNCPTKNKDEMEEKLYDELADMQIMMEQSKIIFDQNRINERIRFKLNKLETKYFATPTDK